MKTIEEAAIEYAVKESKIDSCKPVEIEQQLFAHELQYAFEAGAQFALTWIPIKYLHPQHDSWVLVKTDLCRFPCQVCQVKIDKFISTDNKIVLNVTYWRPIEYK